MNDTQERPEQGLEEDFGQDGGLLTSMETKLIGWSLGIGVTLLVVLVLATGAWRF